MDIQNQIITPMSNGGNPNFEQEVAAIVAIIVSGLAPLLSMIEAIELMELQNNDIKTFIRYLEKTLSETLSELDEKIEETVPLLVQAGLASYLAGMGLSYSKEALEELLKRDIHQYTVDTIILNMKNTYRGVIRNIHGKTEVAMRDVLGQVVRLKYARNTIPFGELRKLQDGLKIVIKEAIGSGIVDKAGRKWKAETYAKVVANSAVMEAFTQTVINEGVVNGSLYGQIIGPPAIDACNKWRGQTIKLVSSAPGSSKTYEEVRASGECFHHNCRHSVRVLTTNNLEEIK